MHMYIYMHTAAPLQYQSEVFPSVGMHDHTCTPYSYQRSQGPCSLSQGTNRKGRGLGDTDRWLDELVIVQRNIDLIQ